MTQSEQQVLAELLKLSHVMAADAVPDNVSRLVATCGLTDTAMFLIDYDQQNLVPLPGSALVEPFAVDTTVGGRAFITGEVVEVEVEKGIRLWLPLLDGGERIGAMCVTAQAVDDATRDFCISMASVVALLLVSKSSYTDVQEMTRRARPVTLASELQLQLLPPLTFFHPDVTLAGVLEDAYETGGDAFDYAVNGTTAHFAIFDAVGHGLAASLMAAAVVAAYRNARRHGLGLEETYGLIDESVRAEFGEQAFVTGHIGQLETSTGAFSWINAGHPQPFIVRQAARVSRLECPPSLPFGFGGKVEDVTTNRLGPGDRLLFFSDGIVEARPPDGDEFGEERLGDLLARESLARLSAAETMRRLLRTVLSHQGSHLADDATMVLVEWTGGATPAP